MIKNMMKSVMRSVLYMFPCAIVRLAMHDQMTKKDHAGYPALGPYYLHFVHTLLSRLTFKYCVLKIKSLPVVSPMLRIRMEIIRIWLVRFFEILSSPKHAFIFLHKLKKSSALIAIET